VSGSVRVLVDPLRARHAEIARAIYDRIREVVPDTVAGRDPSYQAGLLAAVDAVLSYSLDVIEHGPGWSGPIPDEAAEQARRSARAGVALGVVLRRYVAGHGLLGEFVAEETVRLGLASDAVQHISSTHDALLGYLTAVVEDVHNQERQQMVRSPEQRRVDLVRRHLDGEAVSEIDLAGLGYQFDAWHVGVIAVGPSARDVLERLKVDRQLLLVADGERTVWAWLGGQRRFTHAEMDRLLLDNEIAGGALAAGEPTRGLEGWRQTHRQAQHALRVALLAPQTRAARYADAALLIPWIEDPERGRALVELYLSSLAGHKDGGAVLRQTLRIYFECRTASAAARKLRIDRRTLAHRLTTIETAVGYKPDNRKAELEVALRLHDMLKPPGMRNVVPNPSIGFPTLV
jgi:PucR C-terminal helix-turn-helix domain/GGDEF-like domain